MKQNNANGRNIFLVPNADVLADLDFETWLPLADGHKREQLQSMRRQVEYQSCRYSSCKICNSYKMEYTHRPNPVWYWFSWKTICDWV